MIDTVTTDPMWAVGFAAVALLVIGRLYLGPERFNRVAWGPLRRTLLPVLDRVAKHAVGEEWYTAYDVNEDELVAVVDIPPDAVVSDLEAAGFIPEPLAAVKTDWTGRTEAASYAYHHGPKPFPGAPEWLRDRQVHVTLFERDDGTAITAHDEYNSWVPWLWREHYRGIGYEIEAGVNHAAALLDINPAGR